MCTPASVPASTSISNVFFFILMRMLEDLGRARANMKERLLISENGVGSRGPALWLLSVYHIVKWSILTSFAGVWYPAWQFLPWDLTWLAAHHPSPPTPMCLSSLSGTMNDTFWLRVPPHFWSHAQILVYRMAPNLEPALRLSGARLVGRLGNISLSRKNS